MCVCLAIELFLVPLEIYMGPPFSASVSYAFAFLNLKLGNQMLRTTIRLVLYDRSIQSRSSGGGARSMRGVLFLQLLISKFSLHPSFNSIS